MSWTNFSLEITPEIFAPIAAFHRSDAEIQQDGKTFELSVVLTGVRPRDIPQVQGYWQDRILENVDALMGIVRAHRLDGIEGNGQFGWEDKAYSVEIRIKALIPAPDAIAVVEMEIPTAWLEKELEARQPKRKAKA
jgi:hypothetical protein